MDVQTAVKHSDGHIQVAAILVEEGKIDISLKNVEGKTAADLALSADMKAICEPYVASTFLRFLSLLLPFGFSTSIWHFLS